MTTTQGGGVNRLFQSRSLSRAASDKTHDCLQFLGASSAGLVPLPIAPSMPPFMASQNFRPDLESLDPGTLQGQSLHGPAIFSLARTVVEAPRQLQARNSKNYYVLLLSRV